MKKEKEKEEEEEIWRIKGFRESAKGTIDIITSKKRRCAWKELGLGSCFLLFELLFSCRTMEQLKWPCGFTPTQKELSTTSSANGLLCNSTTPTTQACRLSNRCFN